MTTHTRIVLAARPQGQAGLEHFRLETVPFEPLQDGQVRVRHHYLSPGRLCKTRAVRGVAGRDEALGASAKGGCDHRGRFGLGA